MDGPAGADAAGSTDVSATRDPHAAEPAFAAVARDDVEKRRHGRSLFDATVTAAGFAPVTTVEQFTDLHGFIARERPLLVEAKRSLDAASADAIGREKEAARRQETIRTGLDDLQKRHPTFFETTTGERPARAAKGAG